MAFTCPVVRRALKWAPDEERRFHGGRADSGRPDGALEAAGYLARWDATHAGAMAGGHRCRDYWIRSAMMCPCPVCRARYW